MYYPFAFFLIVAAGSPREILPYPTATYVEFLTGWERQHRRPHYVLPYILLTLFSVPGQIRLEESGEVTTI